jgi:hypothetical protein
MTYPMTYPMTYNDKLEVFINLHGNDITMTYPMTYNDKLEVYLKLHCRHTYDIPNDILNDIQ